MKLRMVDQKGDMQFGQSLDHFAINTPEVVAQLIDSRLKLWTGEWFFDVTDGLPWATNVLGEHTAGIYNETIRDRILDTPGVETIETYKSKLDNRKLVVETGIKTLYGKAAIQFGGGEV